MDHHGSESGPSRIQDYFCKEWPVEWVYKETNKQTNKQMNKQTKKQNKLYQTRAKLHIWNQATFFFRVIICSGLLQRGMLSSNLCLTSLYLLSFKTHKMCKRKKINKKKKKKSNQPTNPIFFRHWSTTKQLFFFFGLTIINQRKTTNL